MNREAIIIKESGLIKKTKPKLEAQRSMFFEVWLIWNFLKNKNPNKIKNAAGTTFIDVFEYAQRVVENAYKKARMIEVCCLKKVRETR